MKKVCSLLLLLALILSLMGCSMIKHPYVQEYVAGQGNCRGNVNTADFLERDERFAIGATKDGVAVFKDPQAAFQALLETCSDGLALIQTEMDLEPVSQKNYSMYKMYGAQVTTGSEEEQAQARFVSGFFDIYENSF